MDKSLMEIYKSLMEIRLMEISNCKLVIKNHSIFRILYFTFP